MGAGRGGGYQAHQSCVRTLYFLFMPAEMVHLLSYDAGIQTFDTANVCYIFQVIVDSNS
jgi:hypothetical protein